jgi:DNA-binding MarR family transcriptional regulator
MGREALREAALAETRRLGGLSALFSQAMADRVGLAATDIECLELLTEPGRLPAGRLAGLTGLTSGATTRMIDRLEQAGYVRRVPDSADRRRVMVEAVPERMATLAALHESIAHAQQATIDGYGDAELRAIVDYLARTSAVTRAETAKLRGTGTHEDDSSFVAPLGSVTSGRLVFVTGAPTVVLRADPALSGLYQARFEGPVPRVRVRDGVVTVRYGKFAWLDWRARVGGAVLDASLHWRRDRGEIVLNASLPWAVELRGGVTRLNADLRAVDVRAFDLAGGAGRLELSLAAPGSIVSLRVSGGVNELAIHRPAGTAVRLRVRGGSNRVSLDGQLVKGGGELALETPGAASAAARFDVDVAGGAHHVTVDAR